MHYRIYLDVFFLINLIMDYVVVSIVSTLLKINCKNTVRLYIRKIAAAVFGSLWSCIVVIFRLTDGIWQPVTYFMVCFIMIIILTHSLRPKKILLGWVLMYIITGAVGGAAYIFGRRNFFTITAIGILSGPIIKSAAGCIEINMGLSSYRGTAVIKNNGKSISIQALCDTGNSLYDPYNGEGINIVEADSVKGLWSGEKNMKFHLVPFESVGCKKGLIKVVRMDEITYISEKKTIKIKGPLCALYDGHFSEGTEYKIILHPAIFKEKGV